MEHRSARIRGASSVMTVVCGTGMKHRSTSMMTVVWGSVAGRFFRSCRNCDSYAQPSQQSASYHHTHSRSPRQPAKIANATQSLIDIYSSSSCQPTLAGRSSRHGPQRIQTEYPANVSCNAWATGYPRRSRIAKPFHARHHGRPVENCK